MPTLLITPPEALEIAFASTEHIRPDLISDIRIETAQIKFLRPALGKLTDHLSEARYAIFLREYIKPPLALYIRSLLVEDIATSVGSMGVVETQAAMVRTSLPAQRDRLRRIARNDARVLLRKAIDHIEADLELFPDYDSNENIHNHISINGGLVVER